MQGLGYLDGRGGGGKTTKVGLSLVQATYTCVHNRCVIAASSPSSAEAGKESKKRSLLSIGLGLSARASQSGTGLWRTTRWAGIYFIAYIDPFLCLP